jgi:hypothetical protein
VSATRRVRATNPRRRLAQRAIDIDENGRVIGVVPELAITASSPAQHASYLGDVDTAARRRGPGIIPDLDDLNTVARTIADLALVPVEIVVGVMRKLEGLPKFLLVGWVLVELTKREHASRKASRRRR